ncbi:Rieske domain-containing protein-like [Branchiostoma floridae]|uniref:Rieske domain-containing protein-like n=1 Tax=Branchiostoma floridae TaxID=7739 RepID=A0A9J7KSI4_BRAFL|nr:Rieske domain-containing protein-like [Branchiostoma floridae]
MAAENSRRSGVSEEWRCVGPVEQLRKQKCRRLYAEAGRSQDVALFYVGEKFYALEASCAHAEGPLDQGDIEELNGCYTVVCPLHFYEFNISTGKSESGLRQQTYEVKQEDDNVYVKFGCEPVHLRRPERK